MKKILLLIFIIIATGCATKPTNEISDMVLECFKNKQGIIIRFEPQPENKEAQRIN